MRKLIFLSAFLFQTFFLIGQSVTEFKWKKSFVSFETAKLRTFDPKTNKFISEQFKTSNVWLSNTDLGWPEFYIDIPDKYFCKEFTVVKASYEITPGKTEFVSYILETVNNKDFVALTFSYEPGEDKPNKIFVQITENYQAKVPKKHSYELFELK